MGATLDNNGLGQRSGEAPPVALGVTVRLPVSVLRMVRLVRLVVT